MEREYWLKQQQDGQPLFPELEWSRPESRMQAGKLLVIGGNLHGFAAPAEAYAAAGKAGIGTARVLLPDAVQKIIGRVLENGEFAPSGPSGSFSQKALNDWLLHANWADGVLVAGDLGRNSETAIVLEKFLGTSAAPVTLTKDAVDYVTSAPQIALERPDTLLVLSLSQLQRLATARHYPHAITFGMDMLHLVEWLHGFTATHRAQLVVKHLQAIYVASSGLVCTTRLTKDAPVWRVNMAAWAAVWWLQNQGKAFNAVVTAVHAAGQQ